MNEKRSKSGTCPHHKYGNYPKENSCQCQKKSQESRNFTDEKSLERLEKESEAELEKAQKVLRKTQGATKQNGKISPSSSCIQKQPTVSCKSDAVNESREAVKRLAKVSVRNENECCGGRTGGKSDGKSCVSRIPEYCIQDIPEKENKEFPRKPKLTPEELNELLDQETEDVESAWLLTNEVKEFSKKPCPKQQKARDVVKALIEHKEEPQPLMLSTPIPKEPLPFLDPDPDDISPEVAANMMYSQERGIKMISCPEETVRHLFAESMGFDENNQRKEETQDEFFDPDLDETAEMDDSVYTRNKGQKDKGSKNFDASNNSNDRKTEIVLQEKESKCVNKVQLRGNCAPWFPGYYIAFPDHVGELCIQVTKSPSVVFQKAWMAAKPNNVPSSDLYVVQ